MGDLITQKRDELETFIREQMIGPNGCRGRFSLEMPDGESFDGEVVNTTPGSIYSTAVLFPQKDNDNEEDDDSQNNSSADETVVNDVSNNDEDDTSRSDINEQNGDAGNDLDDEDIYSLSRRFPNTMGVSCCLLPETNINEDVKISVSGRYYTKINGENIQRVQVVVKDNISEFEQFFRGHTGLQQYFSYNSGRLKINHLDVKDAATVKTLLRQVNMDCARTIAMINGEIDPLYLGIKESNRYLLSYREKLFNQMLNRLNRNNEGAFAYISKEMQVQVQERINKIEMYETFMSYFDNLIDLYDYRSFGFWQSHNFAVTLNLSGLHSDDGNFSKQIYKPDNNPNMKHFFKVKVSEKKELALSAWLQVTKNSKDASDKNLYFKVLIVNDSTKFKDTAKNHLSIVNEEVNKFCIFGIRIDLESDYLCSYHADGTYHDIKKDEDKLNFLYRSIHDYGVGHLCSIDWEKNPEGNVNHIWTEFIPSFETPDIEPVPRRKYGEYVRENQNEVPKPYLIDDKCLQFKYLSTFSDATDSDIVAKLKSFVDLYGEWINENKTRITDSNDLQFANDNLSKCEGDMRRMKDNIENILAKNSEYMHCFRLMNSAMFMQLWHNKKENQKKVFDYCDDLDDEFYKSADDCIFPSDSHAAWRPFQLAFILLNLDGIIQNPNDSGWSKRNELVDLVWFPTGGGKTEAYLGIIAFCIIFRRRAFKEKGGGVAAIMRYTLRLLTTQQFQRALRLILALEQVRLWGESDDDYFLGKEQISIGLYVGNNSLPNQEKDLDDEAKKWQNRKDGENNTKIPLDRCPWCGSKLVYSTPKKKFRCDNENDTCTFSDYLPVRLCDEHIYKQPPTLLFGTVDKFASIAHKVSTKKNEENKDSRRIFGKVLKYLPPDLIIQDELHLLLGPLGSAVSLFECAIDQLCTRDDGTRPKIISSTATTRNTELQIRALYDRGLNIFPHNGINYDDSFFAFYKREKIDGQVKFVSKRKYIGIMPTGRTQMTTQMRLSAILLVHRAIFESEHLKDADFEKVADYYYSVIAYFNSLKEVGKTDALFYTEYSKYVRRLFKRVMPFGNLLECFYSMRDLKEAELSGRLSGSEVNAKFAEVAQKWSVENRLPHKVNGEWVNGTTPPDFILATNMISVGLDVARFNTIIMNSMPRNIAEYIQASSRVAREQKGLVLTLHNPFRSRDVSHYEKFREFHEKLYFYVEPISITPFSQKSVEKYLALYLAAIIRQSFIQLADYKSASRINDGDLSSKIRQIVSDYFNNRYERMQKSEISELEKGLLTNDLKDNIIRFADQALEQWENKATKFNDLVYSDYEFTKGTALFSMPYDYDDSSDGNIWTVPMSLRIVEPEAVLHISVDYDGNQRR